MNNVKPADRLHRFNSIYQAIETIREINAQAVESKTWLEKGGDSYKSDGSLVTGLPWWTTPEHTTDPITLECRRKLLRNRAYEHGIIHFLKGLEARGLTSLSSNALKTMTEAATPEIISQLILQKRVPSAPRTVTLSEFRDFYSYSDETNSRTVRDNHLIPLCSLGLLSAHVGRKYAIEIGPVGEIFHIDVYSEIIETTKINGLEH